MSFPSDTGIMVPEELSVVQRAISDIASEDWFTNSGDRRDQFAAYILDYRNGVTDPHSLALQCRSRALVKFDQ